MYRLVLIAALGMPLGAGAATPLFTPPEGCAVYVTIQGKACTVSHLYRCDADPAGQQHRADFGAEGQHYLGTIDSETQWIESVSPRTGVVERLLPNPADPASLSELLAAGVDSYSFSTLTEVPNAGSFVMFYKGQDVLTGKTVIVDGEALQETRYQIVARTASGQEAWRAEGHEYVHAEWRSFLAGTRLMSTPEGSEQGDDSPLTFIFEGEAGFASTTPAYGCGDAVAFLPHSGRGAVPAHTIFPS